MDAVTKLFIAGAVMLGVTLCVSGYMLIDTIVRFKDHVKHCTKC